MMGKGLALEFKQRFPANYDLYRRACSRKLLHPGAVCIWHGLPSELPGYIINAATKDHWRSPSKMEYVLSALYYIKNNIEDLKLQSIAIPALGCGLGGLDWKLVRPSIHAVLGGLKDVDIILFPPQGEAR